ncbi:MAG: hypothetical protein RR651_14055 [Lysinibacillus sp.]
MENYKQLLEKLQIGELENIEINKENFYEFREILVKHQSFKHFRGEAKQGGTIIYTYLSEPRS